MDRASAQNADAVAWARLFHEFAQGYDEELSDQAVRIVWSWPQDPGYDLHGLLALDLVGEVVASTRVVFDRPGEGVGVDV